jgi:multidrug efflux pump subunit AcrB
VSPSPEPPEAQEEPRRGAIAWMVDNPVASNLLMIVFLVGGALFGANIKQEVFPEFDLDQVIITVPYPGASPAEVEEGIVLAIEEEVRGLEGVKEVTAAALEGSATVRAELQVGEDRNRALQDIKNAVDRITTFPEDAEEPQVRLATNRTEVMNLILFGDASEKALRNLGEDIRNELLQHAMITQVDLAGVRPPEIAIQVSRDRLREYDLTLGEIARRVGGTARELPGGDVETPGGEVLLRLDEKRDYGAQFGDIEILSQPDGTSVPLHRLARIVDGFRDTDEAAYFNGKRAVMLKIYRMGDQTPTEVVQVVREEMRTLRRRLPPTVRMSVLYDRSEIFRERFSLLLRNAGLGLVLVTVLLGLFLELRLAFWVMMGIPISFLGSLLLLPGLGVSINMVSLFAFIMALGIVVDDAIVVGENVFELRQRGQRFTAAAKAGALMVAVPVTFSILTNITAFAPMLNVPGFIGKIFRVIPLVITAVFVVSLVEALFILPGHLAHQTMPDRQHPHALERLRRRLDAALRWFIDRVYTPFLDAALRWRYLTVAVALAVLLVTVGLFLGGRIRVIFFPRIASDRVIASAELPFGAPEAETRAVMRRLIREARAVAEAHGGEALVEGVFSQIGARPLRGGPGGGRQQASGAHITNVTVYLVPVEERTLEAGAFEQAWRDRVGRVAGLESLSFESEFGGPSGGAPVNLELSHERMDILETAAAELAQKLAEYPQTSDIDDGFSPGKPQLNFTIRPEARSLGLTAVEVGRQVRHAFYGAEALRQQRGRDELKVMVRLPPEERASEYDIEQLRIRTPGGGEIPFRQAAHVERGRSYTSIDRVEGRRVVNVTAEVTPRNDAEIILRDLEAAYLPELLRRYPGLDYAYAGSREDLRESFTSLFFGFAFAMLVIYAMLAIPFGSYAQPLIVMTSIPFGIVGAVIGHLVMGYNLSVISLFGVVALSGVVVNDSLVLIDYANRLGRGDQTPAQAIREAGARRFRPIMLTSLTTFFGLLPMIFETSIQARFLIPMALSLGYGILFATLIALVLVPTLYLVIEDFARILAGRSTVER